jgi:glutamate dehydrogenase
MGTTWKENLRTKLILHFGEEHGVTLNLKYASGFSKSYVSDHSSDRAVDDIEYLEKLSESNLIEVLLYYSNDTQLHLRLFQYHHLAPLSKIVPILENFDLLTENQRPYKIQLNSEQSAWISDFTITYIKEDCDLESLDKIFQEAFVNVYFGLSENDGFNKLVLGASFTGRDIVVFRAYAKYLIQIRFRFSQPYIERTLRNNTSISQDLLALFYELHDPQRFTPNNKESCRLEHQIKQKLESVASLDEDYILRRLLALIKATLRTNFFQRDKHHQTKTYLSFKFLSSAIPDLPLPQPLYEVFVYSTQFEGIHLRREKIARGGIRWSERPEDFRTEILGLMKAQIVKNSIIVPSGAKGGFVLKSSEDTHTLKTIKTLVVDSYQSFIRALLELTDNYVNGVIIQPQQILCHDEADPYLVVAADKGTASFSDLANEIAKDHHFWLGDAFASGGSTGYDHKKMGITARGAWESIARHFRELHLDWQNTTITVIGIGDMSGDVFGNGMLYSDQIKLLGAFDHRHIFIDPNPDPKISYLERERLFNLPSSSWADYQPQLISKGGGVFSRTLKSIQMTPQMKQAFQVEQDIVTPSELISILLMAPVDLLFNGGIGTYVKSSQESDMDVGDPENNYCRINGNDLRCKVIGEGGNLGITQLGRIEYSLNGGLLFTDFIDNSAGVDCSDHEVNLKILLDNEVLCHRLTEAQRNNLLTSLTQEVANLVLSDNHNQALVLSYSAYSAKKNIGLHIDYIKDLEVRWGLNRKVEFLPNDKLLVERKAAGLGLTRPELAVLLAYTKILLKNEILKSNLPEDPYLKQIIVTAFPLEIRLKFQQAIHEHQLRRNIIATQLSNEIINNMGLTFVYRMQTETGASVEEIIRAYTIANKSFKTHKIYKTIESLDFKLPMTEQFEILSNIRKLINLSTRWFIRGNHPLDDLEKQIKHYSTNIQSIEVLIPELMTGSTKEYLESLSKKFMQANLSAEDAKRIATYRAIYTSLNIISVATRYHIDLEKTSKIYFAGGERMNLVWFRDHLSNDAREDYWHALTRLTLRDELDILQRELTIAILSEDEGELDEQELIDKWVINNQRIVERWNTYLSKIHNSPGVEYVMFFIAIRELTRLILIA